MDLTQRHGQRSRGYRAPAARPRAGAAPGKRRKHFTANIIIDLTGDSATVISNFLVVRDSAVGPTIAVAGTYDDVVVRTPDGWKFKSRKLSHDIARRKRTKCEAGLKANRTGF